MKNRLAWIGVAVLLLASIGPLGAQGPPVARQQDVIYGRKDGMALTLDVFTPTQGANGAAVILVISGGWTSSHDRIYPSSGAPLLARGYTVFAVVHSSQPRYAITDSVADLNRAVRYIRFHAEDFKVDPERFGITGASSGGHLSLMVGTAGDAGDPNAKDPVDRASSRVQAVGCFFPPTDFLNYGEPGRVKPGKKNLGNVRAPFQFAELGGEQGVAGSVAAISDEDRVLQIMRQISPIYEVSPDDPPTLIIHGDADNLVPLQQSESILAKFHEAGVPAELSVRPGGGHGGWDPSADSAKIADWFDKYLASPAIVVTQSP